VNYIPQPGHGAGECFILRIKIDGTGGITFVLHHGFLKNIPQGLKPRIIMQLFGTTEVVPFQITRLSFKTSVNLLAHQPICQNTSLSFRTSAYLERRLGKSAKLEVL
jgi:hypothetical protein